MWKQALGGAGLDLASSFASNMLIGRPNQREAYALADNNSAKAFKRSKKLFKKRYQYTVKDMRKAGLNPILAATGGFNVAGAPTASIPGAAIPPDYTSNSATAAGRNMAQAEAQEAKAGESIANMFKLRAEKGLVEEQERKVVNEAFVAEKQFEVLVTTQERLHKEIARIQAETERTHADIERLDVLKQEIKSNTSLIRKKGFALAAELRRLNEVAEVYNGPAGRLIAYINSIFGKLGLGAVVTRKGR